MDFHWAMSWIPIGIHLVSHIPITDVLDRVMSWVPICIIILIFVEEIRLIRRRKKKVRTLQDEQYRSNSHPHVPEPTTEEEQNHQ
jgi:5'-3' exonuclease